MEDEDIWLRVHQLHAVLDGSSLNREERLQRAIQQYQSLPPTVRRQLLGELKTLALDLFDLLPLTIAVENVIETSHQKSSAARSKLA